MKMLDSGDVSDHPCLGQFQASFDAIDRGVATRLTLLDESIQSHYAVLAADLFSREGRTVKLSELNG